MVFKMWRHLVPSHNLKDYTVNTVPSKNEFVKVFGTITISNKSKFKTTVPVHVVGADQLSVN